MAQHFARTVIGTGPGLLLAHGAGGSVDGTFGPLLDRLARTHTVVGVDYPGTGQTPRSRAPLTLDGLADGLVAAADAAHSRELAAAIPGAELVEISAGHDIGGEAPEEWYTVLAEFLAKVEGSR